MNLKNIVEKIDLFFLLFIISAFLTIAFLLISENYRYNNEFLMMWIFIIFMFISFFIYLVSMFKSYKRHSPSIVTDIEKTLDDVKAND